MIKDNFQRSITLNVSVRIIWYVTGNVQRLHRMSKIAGNQYYLLLILLSISFIHL